MEQSKNTWGGRREGAGRKDPVTQHPSTFRLDLEIYEFLKTKKNKNAYVNQCLRTAMYQELGLESSQSDTAE